jgi:hypothetical protein
LKEPNFNEYEFAQLVNFGIIQELIINGGVRSFSMPTPQQEARKGFDIGYLIPWLNSPHHTRNRGCNIFFQYKLSTEIDGRGNYYPFWKTDYFKFCIPYRKYDRAGRLYDDYNQFQKLKNLSQRYLVYYATNSITNFHEMIVLLNSNSLLGQVPALDIKGINKHKHVTFTSSSNHFKLHSDTIEVKKQSIKELFTIAKKEEKTDFYKDVSFLMDLIISIEKEKQPPKKESFSFHLEKIENYKEEDIFQIKTILVSQYLHRYLKLNWYRIC